MNKPLDLDSITKALIKDLIIGTQLGSTASAEKLFKLYLAAEVIKRNPHKFAGIVDVEDIEDLRREIGQIKSQLRQLTEIFDILDTASSYAKTINKYGEPK